MKQKFTQSVVEFLVTYLLTITVVIILGSVFSLAMIDGQIQFSGHKSKTADSEQHLSILLEGQKGTYRQSDSEQLYLFAPNFPVSGNSDKSLSIMHEASISMHKLTTHSLSRKRGDIYKSYLSNDRYYF